MTNKKHYWALNEDGLLYYLGTHENYDSADNDAEQKKLFPIWLIGEEDARDWLDILTETLKEN